jgi:predicted RNA-binding protein
MMDLPLGIAPQGLPIHLQNNQYTFHLFVDAHNQVVCDIFCILKPLITTLSFIHL